MKTSRLIALLGFCLLPIFTQGADDPQKISEMSRCATIECIKAEMEKTSATPVVPAIKIVDERKQAERLNPKFRSEMDRAMKIAKDQVLTDAAAEQLLLNIGANIDNGVPVDEEIATYTLRDDGVEDLLVVGFTKSDIRLMIGTRAAADRSYKVVTHIAFNGSEQRLVQMEGDIALRPQVVLESVEAQEVMAPTESVVAQVAPLEVACFGFSKADGSVRIVCVCYSVNSGGLTGKVCYDSGWLPAK